MTKILITGASGFLGQWLTRQLVQNGEQVRILVRHLPEELKSLPIEIVYGDITKLEELTSACQGIAFVYHLAGVVGYSKAMRPLMDRVNVEGVKNLITAAREAGVERIVHVSSVTAVGASFDGQMPLNEETPFNLKHLNLGYFETKHEGETLIRNAVFDGQIDAVIVNPSTIYGAGDAEKGSRNVQLKVARGEFPFYTSGGVSVVHVEDVVNAMIKAMAKGHSGERYILCGENITIRELFEMISEEAGVRAPRIYLPNAIVRLIGRYGDLMEKLGRKGPLNSENAWSSILFHWFDHAKATRELGFQPRPARAAIHDSVEWMKLQKLI